MRRTPWIRGLVLGSVGLAVLAFGLRPPARGGQPTAALATIPMGGAFGGGKPDEGEPGRAAHVASPMSLEATKVWLKLQDKVAMNFPNDTPLADLKKYIEQATREPKGAFPVGIPIYFDPQGLQDADKTMASTVSINLEGLPLATTLELVLKQLGLGYKIQKDGLLIITSEAAAREGSEVAGGGGDADGIRLILQELARLRGEVAALRREVQARGPGGSQSQGKPESQAPGRSK